MKRSQLSLKWLEVFQLAARSGTIQSVAHETGLSVSTVSHHIRSLEDSLGVSLLDHSRRPMTLTPAGIVFLRNIEEALRLIRKAEVEAKSGVLSQTRDLTLALIEDFDSEIAPELIRVLATSMPDCAFRHFTRPSHEILDLLRSRDVDLGIATRPQFDSHDLVEYPLVRDPFVLAVPAGREIATDALLTGSSPLPFLRYSRSQIIGAMIEGQLRRLRITLPNKFEFESNQSLLGLVAEGAGWTITTPLNYMRARRFQPQIALLPFPGKGFGRTISLFATDIHPRDVAITISQTVSRMIRSRALTPSLDRHPWLRDQFTLPADRT